MLFIISHLQKATHRFSTRFLRDRELERSFCRIALENEQLRKENIRLAYERSIRPFPYPMEDDR